MWFILGLFVGAILGAGTFKETWYQAKAKFIKNVNEMLER